MSPEFTSVKALALEAHCSPADTRIGEVTVTSVL